MASLVTIIMPALNEASSITEVVKGIPVEELARRGYQTEILVVDNGSEDNTRELAVSAGAYVVEEPKRGYGNAYRRGFQSASGEVICTLDADCSYPSEILPDLVDRLIAENLDFITTNRFAYLYDGIMPPLNRVGNHVLSLTSRLFFGLPFRDSQSGMWVFRPALLKQMRLEADGMALSQEIKIEAACRLKANCVEVPINYGYRRGTPKLRAWRDGFSNLTHLFRKRFS
jgi:glycosyltransferase involved in cell wall biosynthesis